MLLQLFAICDFLVYFVTECAVLASESEYSLTHFPVHHQRTSANIAESMTFSKSCPGVLMKCNSVSLTKFINVVWNISSVDNFSMHIYFISSKYKK